jgi:hypothetical protein
MRAIGLILLIIFGITLTTGADAADTKKGETLATHNVRVPGIHTTPVAHTSSGVFCIAANTR